MSRKVHVGLRQRLRAELQDLRVVPVHEAQAAIEPRLRGELEERCREATGRRTAGRPLTASDEGNLKVVQALLAKEGLDPNQATNSGETSLFIASCN